MPEAVRQMPDQLVDAEELIRVLFTDASRPSLRTIRDWQQKRVVPWIKVGGRVWFSPAEVRKALADRFTITARGGSR